MTENPDQQNVDAPRRPRTPGNLVLWLLLVPCVFGILIFFSRLATVINLEELAANTGSFLQARYQPWPYDEIPPINIAAFFSDIQKDIEILGTPVVTPTIQEGTFWEPPTPEVNENEQATQTFAVEQPTSTQTEVPPERTPTKATPSVTPSKVFTATQVTKTPTSTPVTPVVYPSFTPEPEDTKPTLPPAPTATRTPTPTQTTIPVIPTDVATVPVEPPSRLPVHPIAENNGQSFLDPDGQGCLGYFGYRNDNSSEVEIPIGDLNYLSETPIRLSPGPGQPTFFYTDRVSPAFEVVWNNPGVPFVWYLDGREAALQWCNNP